MLARHVEPEAAFQQAFAETHETIGHRLSDYYSRQLFATRQLPLRTPDSHDTHGSRDRDGKTTSYSVPQVPSLLAITSDLLLRAGRVKESAAMAAGTIRDATIADPDAVGVLAKARSLQGRPDEARALFQKAIARPEAGVLPRYYYAEFLVSHASPGSAAATPSAQDASVASQALTPLLDTFPNLSLIHI